MTAARRRVPEGYGVVRFHFEEGDDLRDVVTALFGIDRAYSELAFLDGTLAEWHEIVQQEPSSETASAQAATVIVRRLVSTANHPGFDASYAVDATVAGARVITGRSGGSWVVELLGKLNPIEGLKSMPEMVRYWGPDRDRKRLLNSKLAQEVIGQRIANRISQLELVRQSLDLLERGGVEGEDIQRFVEGRVTGITGGAIRASIGGRTADVTSAEEYAQRPRDARSMAPAVSRLDDAPLLWAGPVLPPGLPEHPPRTEQTQREEHTR